ncbi:MAG: gluconate 2-dehydrogenase subunit 3 family protein [Bacteroidota bacterium]|nr:gluconate 2-dehydrogenase subunit 3 family protein [Bacteroidota bacterium]
MDRRELLKMIALATGSVMIGGEVFLTGCNNPDKVFGSGVFTEDDIAFLDEVAETILPKTNTPGAKEAKTGEFMRVMVNDCYTKEDQQVFHNGIGQLNEACKKKHGHDFMKADPAQRKELLITLDKEAKETTEKKKQFDKEQNEKEKEELAKGNKYDKKLMASHYFTMMKQLTLLGYFTSKEGKTGALRYIPVPGKYDGNLDYKKGDKAFAGLN